MATPEAEEQALREDLVQAMRRMHASGLNRGTSGNASVRVPGGLLVTPSGIPPDALTPGGMVFVADDGTASGTGKRPSTEFRMHHRILQQRPDAQAVVHCHSRHATILACCNRPVPPIHYMVLATGGAGVPIAGYAAFGTSELANLVVDAMGLGLACLMANHGQVAIGRSLMAALAVAEEVEEQAAVFYGALLVGGARELSAAELADAASQFRKYGQ